MQLEGADHGIERIPLFILVVRGLGAVLRGIENANRAFLVASENDRFIFCRVEAEGVYALRRDLDS